MSIIIEQPRDVFWMPVCFAFGCLSLFVSMPACFATASVCWYVSLPAYHTSQSRPLTPLPQHDLCDCYLLLSSPFIGLQNRETILLPHRPDIRLSSSMVKLSIVKVLEFSSQTLRSGAVVLSEDAPPGSALLFLRGAPAVIRSLVNPATVPHDFDQVGVSVGW